MTPPTNLVVHGRHAFASFGALKSPEKHGVRGRYRRPIAEYLLRHYDAWRLSALEKVLDRSITSLPDPSELTRLQLKDWFRRVASTVGNTVPSAQRVYNRALARGDVPNADSLTLQRALDDLEAAGWSYNTWMSKQVPCTPQWRRYFQHIYDTIGSTSEFNSKAIIAKLATWGIEARSARHTIEVDIDEMQELVDLLTRLERRRA